MPYYLTLWTKTKYDYALRANAFLIGSDLGELIDLGEVWKGTRENGGYSVGERLEGF